jgi:hypothetical protein
MEVLGDDQEVEPHAFGESSVADEFLWLELLVPAEIGEPRHRPLLASAVRSA